MVAGRATTVLGWVAWPGLNKSPVDPGGVFSTVWVSDVVEMFVSVVWAAAICLLEAVESVRKVGTKITSYSSLGWNDMAYSGSEVSSLESFGSVGRTPSFGD